MRTISKHLLFLFLLVNLIHFSCVESLPVQELQTRGVVDILSNIFRGKGTFFHPVTEGGAIGSCGPVANDHSRICAMVNKKRFTREINIFIFSYLEH